MTITLTTEADHLKEARALLLGQFQDQSVLTAFLDALVRQVSKVEAAAMEVMVVRNGDIDNMLADGLNKWGKILGVDRNGRDDADYKVALKLTIGTNLSSGTNADLLNIVLILAPTAVVEIVQNPPASFRIIATSFSGTDDDAAEMALLLARARASGVAGSLEYSDLDADALFTWEAGTTPVASSGQGWPDPLAFPFPIKGGELTFLLTT